MGNFNGSCTEDEEEGIEDQVKSIHLRFLDKEYSFEVSQTILAVPSFSKISVKKWVTFTVNSAEILQTILQNASNLIYNCILIDLFSDGERTFSGKHLTEVILIK